MTKKALPKPSTNNPQIASYVQAVKKGLEGQHVVPSSGGWAVKRTGATKASGIYDTQQEALRNATRIAKNNRTEVFVHAKDGHIRERNSYGSDPYPPTG